MATHINTFDARGLANSAWAFGKLKYSPSQKLPALIAAAAMDKMEAFSAQNLSNLLWSFVYLHYRNEQLMSAMAKQVKALVIISHCSLNGLLNTAYLSWLHTAASSATSYHPTLPPGYSLLYLPLEDQGTAV